jgi:pimeloyl-ACP methyl ester carboxylesterase
VSGLGGATYDATARTAGLRWISPDKPGYGSSDYQRKRSVSGWSDDLAALAGHLGLDRFALVGESGGVPFTLTAAHRLADRVSVVALIASGGPIGPDERAGQKARHRVRGWLARNVPVLNTAQVAAMRWTTAPARLERGPAPRRPWTFPRSEVKAPVHLWHGAADRNALIAFARRLAGELPDATLHVSDASGHDVGVDRSDEIMSVLALYLK